jgi:hypothetical protein
MAEEYVLPEPVGPAPTPVRLQHPSMFYQNPSVSPLPKRKMSKALLNP